MEVEASSLRGQEIPSSSTMADTSALDFHKDAHDSHHLLRQQNSQESTSHNHEEEEEEEDEEEEEYFDEEEDHDDSLELPENTYRSRHHMLLSNLGAPDGTNGGDHFPDIQFFHKQIQGNIFHANFDYDHHQNGGSQEEDMQLDSLQHGSHHHHHQDQNMDENDRANNSQDNPFVFPGDVMEYGEPQFFPGNCVGYLETILEETDEEYEEEEGCSGRHWWTADSDTDTDSVIRVDNNTGLIGSNNQQQHFTNNPALNFYRPAPSGTGVSPLDFQPTRLGLPDFSSKPISLGGSAFRTTASSRPFEMEDIHLLDQLDLAFEETLMESPRRRLLQQQQQQQQQQQTLQQQFTSLRQSPPEKPFETEPAPEDPVLLLPPEVESTPIQVNDLSPQAVNHISVPCKPEVGEEHLPASPSIQTTAEADPQPGFQDDDDIEPAEVNEEDFFRSSPEPSEEDSAEEGESSQVSSSSSSSGEGRSDGVVLAEFSLNSSFSNAVNQRFRRSFEGSAKLRSFRSFDSLHCLSGTELLFSKADTFPSFHDITEVVEESERAEASAAAAAACAAAGTSGSIILSNPGARDLDSDRILDPDDGPRQLRTVRKSSDSSSESQITGSTPGGDERQSNMSTENLSEDSGIGGDPSGGSALNLLHHLHQPVQPMSSLGSTDSSESPSLPPYIPKSEFALNPFVFSSLSSASEEASSNFFHQIAPTETSRSNPELLDASLSTTAPPPDLVAHCSSPRLRKHSLDSHSSDPHIDTAMLRMTSNSEVLLKFSDEDDMFAGIATLNGFSPLSSPLPPTMVNGSELLSESIHLELAPQEECLIFANKAILPPTIKPFNKTTKEENANNLIGKRSTSGRSGFEDAFVIDQGLVESDEDENDQQHNHHQLRKDSNESSRSEQLRPMSTRTNNVGECVEEMASALSKPSHNPSPPSISQSPPHDDHQQGEDEDADHHLVQATTVDDVPSSAPTTSSSSQVFEHTQFASSDIGILHHPTTGGDNISHTPHHNPSPPPLCPPQSNLLLLPGDEQTENRIPPSRNQEPVVDSDSAWTDVPQSSRPEETLEDHHQPAPSKSPQPPTTKTTTFVVKFISVAPKLGSESSSASADYATQANSQLSQTESISKLLPAAASVNFALPELSAGQLPAPPTSETLPATRMEAPDSVSPIPVKTKVYGARNEVEVFLVSSRTPSPIMKPSLSPTPTPDSVAAKLAGVKKEVHFSPVVSEISWRESYIDQQSSASSDGALDEPESSVDDVLEGKLVDHNHSSVSGDNKQGSGSHYKTPPVEIVRILSNESSFNMDEDRRSASSPTANKNKSNGHSKSPPSPTAGGTRPHHLYEDIETITASPTPSGNQLSMVPDLLSQCETLSPSHTHISINIEPKPKINKPRAKTPSPSPPPPEIRSQEQQQRPMAQILPAKFADKSKKASTPGGASPSKKDKDAAAAKENKGSNKPGFFERLSKIRLSGSSKSKKKVHPKEKDTDAGKVGIQAEESTKSPTVHLTRDAGSPHQRPHAELITASSDPEKSHETFENILDDIAGINSIKSRQQQQNLHQSHTLPLNKDKGKDSVRNFAQRKQFLQTLPGSGGREVGGSVSPTSGLEEKLSQFKEDTSRTRTQISQSHPDLEIIQGVVRESVDSSAAAAAAGRQKLGSAGSKSENNLQNRESSPTPLGSSASPPSSKSPPSSTQPKTEREWYKLLKNAAEKYYYRGSSSEQKDQTNFKTGIVETDLDTGTSREMLDLDSERVELVKVPCSPSSTAKTQSLTNLSSRPIPLSLPAHHHRIQDGDHHLLAPQGEFSDSDERAKSLEFLLDENHKSSSVPPENQLRQESRQLSEHELRIQRSLQKLNVPDWYKNHNGNQVPNSNNKNPEAEAKKAATLSKRSEFGSGSGLAGGWAGLSAYKTSSLSSLQYNGRWGGSINRGSNFVRGRPATMSTSAVRTSKESLLSPSSTASQSPSAFERCSFTYGMPFNQTRYGHGRLSTGTASISPPSTPVNPAGPTYVKKPYLGWRSQERLNKEGQPVPINSTSNLKLSLYRNPAERAANDLLSGRGKLSLAKPVDRPNLPKPPPRTSSNPPHIEPLVSTASVHDSIREVSEQINQFVNKDSFEGPRPLPRQKRSNKPPLVWMESSFVGTKPTA